MPDFEAGMWKKDFIAHGMPRKSNQEASKKDFWGSACVDVGKSLDDPFAFIATVDAFHGMMTRSGNERRLIVSRDHCSCIHKAEEWTAKLRMEASRS